MTNQVVPQVPTLYWRPGCPYCSSLRRRLRKLGVATNEVNIWQDPGAAGVLREITGGDETVPTVLIGGKALVNPSARAVLGLLEGKPQPAGATGERSWTWHRVAQWIVIAAIIAGSFIVDSLGDHLMSWGLDGVALATLVAFRLTRR